MGVKQLFNITKNIGLRFGSDEVAVEALFVTTRNGQMDITFTQSSGTINIDWGDGSDDDHTGGLISHTYSDGSSKDIVVTGDVENITALTSSTMSITEVDLSTLTGLVSTTLTGNLFTEIDFTANVLLTSIDIKSIASLSDVTFPTHSATVVNISIQNSSVTELDFTTFSEFAGEIDCRSNSSLTSTPFPTTTNVFTRLGFNNCNLTGEVDISVVPNCATYNFTGNINITSVVFPSTAHAIGTLSFSSCGLSGAIDVSSMTNITGTISLANMSGITSFTFGANTGISSLFLGSTSINAVSNLEANNGLSNISLDNCGSSQAEVDTIVGQVYGNRVSFTKPTLAMTLGGSNAAPTGTFQAGCPPVTANEEVFELVNDSCGDGHTTWTISTS